MNNFENIATESWSNIPQCIIQSISSLVENSKIQKNEIESIQGTLTDLVIKFGVKTSRYDTSLQEISNNIRLFTNTSTNEIVDTKTKINEFTENFEKKIKNLTEICHENKNKYNTFYGEFRKECKESNNKLEKTKSDLITYINETNENIRELVEYNEKTAIKSINHLKDVTEENKKIFEEHLKNLELKITANYKIIEDLKVPIFQNTHEIRTVQHEFFEINEKISILKQEILMASKKIDNFVIPVPQIYYESPDSSPRSEIEGSFLNPFSEKLLKLEELIAKCEISTQAQIKTSEKKLEKDLESLKSLVEKAIEEKTDSKIKSHFESIRAKLEWLPDKSADIKGMTVTEARLFLLESRIRSEENARIIADTKIKTDFQELKETGSLRNSTLFKNQMISPLATKVIDLGFENKVIKPRTRPNSCYNRRDSLGKEKQREKFVIRVQEA